MKKHPKLEMIERLLWKDRMKPSEVIALAWPDAIEELIMMTHYWAIEIEPLESRKSQAQAVFACVVKRAMRLAGNGPAPATQ